MLVVSVLLRENLKNKKPTFTSTSARKSLSVAEPDIFALTVPISEPKLRMT
jgi:hypothetical protein